MGERERIARYFAPLTLSETGAFSLTDDAACLTPPTDASLVITTDSVIESIHVIAGATPQQFAQKLVRRNLSDLAAMGATPWRYSLNLHTPHGITDAWIADFSATLASEQIRFNMALIGGDSTSAANAPIHATMTCFGLIYGNVLRRNAARMGDDIYVSGTIGDAALGLAMMQQKLPHDASLITRYHTPEPRLALGDFLRNIATAAIDISDGLLADIEQICMASNVGARITQHAIPRSYAAQQLLQQHDALWEMILNGGDDYELCFTAPKSARDTLATHAQKTSTPITRIGEIIEPKMVEVVDERGVVLPVQQAGYSHR